MRFIYFDKVRSFGERSTSLHDCYLESPFPSVFIGARIEETVKTIRLPLNISLRLLEVVGNLHSTYPWAMAVDQNEQMHLLSDFDMNEI